MQKREVGLKTPGEAVNVAQNIGKIRCPGGFAGRHRRIGWCNNIFVYTGNTDTIYCVGSLTFPGDGVRMRVIRPLWVLAVFGMVVPDRETCEMYMEVRLCFR